MDLSNINVEVFVDNKIEEAMKYLSVEYVVNKDLSAEEKIGFFRGVSEAFSILKSVVSGDVIEP